MHQPQSLREEVTVAVFGDFNVGVTVGTSPPLNGPPIIETLGPRAKRIFLPRIFL